MTRLALIAVIAWSSAARAQPITPPAEPANARATEQAKQLYDAGSKHYDLHEFRAAVDAFRKAYAVLPDPQFLFNIAQASRKLGDCVNARAFYSAYLRGDASADRAQVARLMATTDECVAEEQVAAAREHRWRLVGTITAAAGAAVAAGGIYFSVDASRQASAIEKQCAAGCLASDVAAIDRRGLDSARDAVLLYGVGGAAVAVGIGVLLWVSLGSHGGAVASSTPGGAMVTVAF